MAKMYPAVLFFCIISHVASKLPIHVPGVVIKGANSHCNLKPSSAAIESLKSDIVNAIGTLYPNNCNCSSLLSENNETCLSSCCHEDRLLFDADWGNGTSYIAPNSGLTWRQQPYDPSSTQTCDSQSVLQIDFLSACNTTASNCKLKFDFYLRPSHSGWNFNIGDSHSNDGYGGDGGDTSNAAEVHNLGNRFLVYSNNLPGYSDFADRRLLLVDNVRDVVVTDHFTVVVGDEFVMFDNNNGVQKSYRSRYLFTLNGQPTTYGPVNYLIYLGMNRVINGRYRSGTGLCRVTIRALHC